MTTMKAAVLRSAPGDLSLEDVTIDSPVADEVQVKVVASGLCHSDLHVMEKMIPSPLPSVLGHEAAGVVTAVGDNVRHLKVGDHVISCLSAYCGRCNSCVVGKTYLCLNRGALSAQRAASGPVLSDADGTPIVAFGGLGAFAEMMTVHNSALVAIDPEMPLDRAALIGCGVLTGVGAAVNEARMRPGETCVVIGCGGIGLNVVQGAAMAGAGRIIAVDLSPAKLELAQRFGATDVVNPADGDPVEAVKALTGGLGVDHAFEAIGLKATTEQAINMAGVGGGAYLIGVMPVGQNVEVHGLPFAMSGKRLHGVRMGSGNIAADFPKLVDQYQRGKLLLDELISERISLDQVNEGYARMKTGEHARSVIMFD